MRQSELLSVIVSEHDASLFFIQKCADTNIMVVEMPQKGYCEYAEIAVPLHPEINY